MRMERDFKKEFTLQNETRRSLFKYIEQNPGVYFNSIRIGLSLPTGQLLHHLGVLLNEGFVRKQRDGRLVRFFVYDFKISSMKIRSNKQSQILSLITKFPNISQKEIITRTGICQSTTSWILSDLKKSKLLVQTFTIDKSGRGHLGYRAINSLLEPFNDYPICVRKLEIEGLTYYCPYCNKRLTCIETD